MVCYKMFLVLAGTSHQCAADNASTITFFPPLPLSYAPSLHILPRRILCLALTPHNGEKDNASSPHDTERLEESSRYLGPSRLMEHQPDRMQRNRIEMVHEHHPATCDS